MAVSPLVCAAVLTLLTVTACGSGSGSPPVAADDRPPTVSAPPGLHPDGTVPWIDEPAGLREFDIPPPPSVDAGDAEPCTARDLAAVLPRWIEKGDAGEEEAASEPAGLYGSIQVRLVGDEPCTLRGAVTASLQIAGEDAAVTYSNNVNDEARRRITVVTATDAADLRVDWSPPYCGPNGPQQLMIELPDDGGTLPAPVQQATMPPCTGPYPEGDRGLRSHLSTSAFDRARQPTPLNSPLRVLRASAEQLPESAQPGQAIEYIVRLTNPTAQDVMLEPCPGYYTSRFVLGTGDRAGFNSGQVYRLNCRPVSAVPAGGSIAFRMRADVPADPPGGPTFSVSWRLVAPYLAGEAGLSLGFELPISD